jgi:DNA-binding MarR family transcriptional regulator
MTEAVYIRINSPDFGVSSYFFVSLTFGPDLNVCVRSTVFVKIIDYMVNALYYQVSLLPRDPAMTQSESPLWYEDMSLPAMFRFARNTYGVAMRRALEAAGYDDIPGNGLYVIGGLAKGADGVPLGQLIKELRTSKQAAGQLVDALVLRGYLQRVPDETDRRKMSVSLTERGRAAAVVQTQAREKIDAELLAGVGQEAVTQMRRALAELWAISQRQEREGPAANHANV